MTITEARGGGKRRNQLLGDWKRERKKISNGKKETNTKGKHKKRQKGLRDTAARCWSICCLWNCLCCAISLSCFSPLKSILGQEKLSCSQALCLDALATPPPHFTVLV